MRDLPLSLLRVLAAISSQGGVRSAAKFLGVEHSSISRSLHDLEEWVGVPLTQQRRRGQRLRLSAQGADLAEVAVAAIRDLEQATARLREARTSKRVVIATPPSVANRWLLPRLDQLEAACPDVEISIVVDTIRMGGLDPLADLSFRMGGRPDFSDTVRIVGSDIAFPVMSPRAWEAAGCPSDVASLSSLPILHDRDPRTAWATWREAFGPADLDVRSGARFTSADLVLRAAERGRGVALTRGWLAEEALAEGLLVRPFGELCLTLKDEWWVAEHGSAATRAPVRRVRDWLVQMAESDDGLGPNQ